MRVITRILIVLVAIAVLLAIIGLFLPSSAHVERSITIDAPQSTVFALINGFRGFNQWSPWFDRDPEAQYTYEGPDFGVGAKMSWTSEQSDVGSGSQEIVASEPYGAVRMTLDFGEQGTARSFFELTSEADGTGVTWGFDTEFGLNLISRYFGLAFDSLLGPDYETGLANLKELVESLPKLDWSDLDIQIVEVEPVAIAYVTASSEPAGVPETLNKSYAEVQAFMAAQGISQAGARITLTNSWDEQRWDFDAAIPIDRIPEEVEEPSSRAGSAVQIGETYGGQVVKTVLVESGTGGDPVVVYDKIRAFVAAHALESAGRSWEEYPSDPAQTSHGEFVTHVYFPVK